MAETTSTEGPLRVRREGGVAFATIDNPPINLFDVGLLVELDRFSREVEADDEVKVVVLDSANPDFFIAHFDVMAILGGDPGSPEPEGLGFFHAVVDRFRTMPKATIAAIEGRVRGGGSELVLSCDMRFGARGRAVFGQPEVALGIIPGGSGTQRLPRLAGRARALEIILGCEDFDADTAERYGWINRALEPGEVKPFVGRLARRIATFPADAIARSKVAVDAASGDVVEGLREEWRQFQAAAATGEARRRMQRFLADGGQTRAYELDLGSRLESLGG